MAKGKRKKKQKGKYEDLVLVLRVFSLLIPLPVYLIITAFVFPAPNSGFLVLGYVGSAFIGLALLSLVGKLDGLYFGHMITGILFLLGLIPIGVSSFILYCPGIYQQMDERMVTLYFLIWACIAIPCIWYWFFRMSLHSLLRRRGISRSRIKDLMEGRANFWWYEQIHVDSPLGWVFILNKGFTIVFPLTVVFPLALGWIKVLCFASALLLGASCILHSMLWGGLLCQERRIPAEDRSTNLLPYLSGMVFPLVIDIVLVVQVIRF